MFLCIKCVLFSKCCFFVDGWLLIVLEHLALCYNVLTKILYILFRLVLKCKRYINAHHIKCVYTLGIHRVTVCFSVAYLHETPNRNKFHFLSVFVLTCFFNHNIYVYMYKDFGGWVINIWRWNRISKYHISKAFSWIRFHPSYE